MADTTNTPPLSGIASDRRHLIRAHAQTIADIEKILTSITEKRDREHLEQWIKDDNDVFLYKWWILEIRETQARSGTRASQHADYYLCRVIVAVMRRCGGRIAPARLRQHVDALVGVDDEPYDEAINRLYNFDLLRETRRGNTYLYALTAELDSHLELLAQSIGN